MMYVPTLGVEDHMQYQVHLVVVLDCKSCAGDVLEGRPELTPVAIQVTVTLRVSDGRFLPVAFIQIGLAFI
jgi:hypothetical protein